MISYINYVMYQLIEMEKTVKSTGTNVSEVAKEGESI